MSFIPLDRCYFSLGIFKNKNKNKNDSPSELRITQVRNKSSICFNFSLNTQPEAILYVHIRLQNIFISTCQWWPSLDYTIFSVCKIGYPPSSYHLLVMKRCDMQLQVSCKHWGVITQDATKVHTLFSMFQIVELKRTVLRRLFRKHPYMKK